MPNPTRISDLVLTTPKTGDQIPIARGAGASGSTQRIFVENILTDLLNVGDTSTIDMSFNTSTKTLCAQLMSPVAINKGGTGLTTTPMSGQLLIGNGSGYSLATLSAGAGITIDNKAGQVGVAAQVPVGTVLQTLFTTNSNILSTTNVYPFSTKPQYNASNIILTQAITVQSASNKVLIQGQISGGKITGTGQEDYVVALFNTESGDAIAAQLYYHSNTGDTFNFNYLHSPGSAGTFTYRLGLGCTSAGTVYFNKRFANANSSLGGLHMSSMLVQEIKG